MACYINGSLGVSMETHLKSATLKAHVFPALHKALPRNKLIPYLAVNTASGELNKTPTIWTKLTLLCLTNLGKKKTGPPPGASVVCRLSVSLVFTCSDRVNI